MFTIEHDFDATVVTLVDEGDAALGGRPSWKTVVSSQEVDFIEAREDGWAASVSVILGLHRTDDEETHMTGRGTDGLYALGSGP